MNSLRQAAQQPAAARADRRRLAVHRHVEHRERAAEIFDDPLQAEADAKNRQLPLHQQIEGLGHCEIRRPPRPRRQHDEIVTAARPQFGAGQIGAHRHDLGAGRADVIGQGVDERIFVIDQQHPAAPADLGRRDARGAAALPSARGSR